jgi:phosphoribosyl-ATP pyrophosphohydrolase
MGKLRRLRRSRSAPKLDDSLSWLTRCQLPILPDAHPFGKATVAIESNPFLKLERTISARAKKPNPKSYTSQLLAGGVERIGAKIVEEAAEVVEAAGESGREGAEHFVREVGDLIYHLIVMLHHKECKLADVDAELARRFGVSGLEEKAARKSADAKSNSKKSAVKASTKSATKPAAKVSVPAVKKKARRKSRL